MGKPLHTQRKLPKRNRVPTIRIRTLFVHGRANRGGTCALSNVCARGLVLWRIVSLDLPHGRPVLEEGPTSTLLRGLQNLGLGALSRTDFWTELVPLVTRVLGN